MKNNVSVNINQSVISTNIEGGVVVPTEIIEHLNSSEIHITNTERNYWNDKQDTVDINLVELFEGTLG